MTDTERIRSYILDFNKDTVEIQLKNAMETIKSSISEITATRGEQAFTDYAEEVKQILELSETVRARAIETMQNRFKSSLNAQ